MAMMRPKRYTANAQFWHTIVMTIKALIISAYYIGATTLAADHNPAAQALNAVETELRRLSSTPKAVGLRRVSVFQQSAPNTVAICGQVSPTGAESAFVDFAAVVTTQETGGEVRVEELHLADGPSGAAQTMAMTFLRCGNEARRIDMTADADLPAPPHPSLPVAPRAPTVTHSLPTRSTVTIKQGSNLRAAPNAQSEVLRVIPRGTVAQVFGEATGGWYQIGDTEPWGWVHGSMLGGPPQ
jgi:Bacterial SH3 domain